MPVPSTSFSVSLASRDKLKLKAVKLKAKTFFSSPRAKKLSHHQHHQYIDTASMEVNATLLYVGIKLSKLISV